ncbi:MAG: HEPN domain-containing protein [Patescibacteria group bacterium]
MTNIEYWVKSSRDDLDTAEKLFALKKYHHSLFFVHLALEKILKAVYVSRKKSFAPPIHDLVRLLEKSGVETSEDQISSLSEISAFSVVARYDDYRFKFYKKATKEYAKKWLKTSKELYQVFNSKI